jgi:hypothetical protein
MQRQGRPERGGFRLYSTARVTSTPWARLPVTRSRVFDLVLLGLYIDDRLGNPCERLVGIFFFLQRSFEESHGLFKPKLFRPCRQRAIAGNLVVLHGLAEARRPASSAGIPLKSFMTSAPSSVMPLIAAHVLPLAGLPKS